MWRWAFRDGVLSWPCSRTEAESGVLFRDVELQRVRNADFVLTGSAELAVSQLLKELEAFGMLVAGY